MSIWLIVFEINYQTIASQIVFTIYFRNKIRLKVGTFFK